jgi:hypothetical protein
MGRRKVPAIQNLSAAALFLVPDDFGPAAWADPLFFLRRQPFLKPAFPNILQVGFHRPVVRPFVVHEFVQRPAREIIAKTAEVNTLFVGAPFEPAGLDQIIRPVAAAAVTILRSAGTAKDTTRSVLVFFTGILSWRLYILSSWLPFKSRFFYLLPK